MNELVVRIEADSAGTLGDRGVAQIDQGNAGKAEIDGLALHVQALLRHSTAAGAAQPGVGLGATVAGNDLERLLAVQLLPELEKQVERLRVDAADFTRVMVPQKKVETLQPLGKIAITDGKYDERRSPVWV